MPGQSSQVAESELENAGPNAGSCVYVCAGACGGQRSTLGVLLSLFLFLRPGLDSLMIPDLAVAGHPAFGFCLSCFPSMAPGLQASHVLLDFVKWSWGLKSEGRLGGERFHANRHLTGPTPFFFFSLVGRGQGFTT